MSGATIAGAPWLTEPRLQHLLGVLSEGGEEARVAGGAIRNTLLGEPVSDIDIATTNLPGETVRRAGAAGLKAVPTGIEHGTVTIVSGGTPFEVTTLRSDVETDGRRARVAFGRDWKADAERRDFTINALYAEADGTIVDLVGGLPDIAARRLRFIGKAEDRIREDYLRILRFFRFFAWYGDGRPDADGLKACVRLRDGIATLSAERIWAEFRKLISAPDPSRALLWMRQAGVLALVLPEGDKWGIDSIHPLVKAERDLGWPADPLLRLQALLPPDAERMKLLSERLRLSSAEAVRLTDWAASPPVSPTLTESALARRLYQSALARRLYLGSRQGILDRLRLALASARGRALQDDAALVEAGGLHRQLRFAEEWSAPVFPLRGADLLDAGVPAGPEVGRVLGVLRDQWMESDFTLGRDALLSRVAEIGKG